MTQKIEITILAADKSGRVVITLEYYNHEEMYRNGYYIDIRGYVIRIRSESIEHLGNGVYRTKHDVFEDWDKLILLYEMEKGERRTKKLDEAMREEYKKIVKEYSDVIQAALRGED